ncbi:hypothetical protein [Streptomyces roseolus]|uniref:hypothetical protein n=1 Tax=Streptomyces TaxID=1883 RepID=UPI0036E743BD
MVGRAEMDGCLPCGLGLLVVVAGAVPVLGGDDREQEGVEGDREERAVLGGGLAQDRLHRLSGGLGLLVFGAEQVSRRRPR